VALETNSPRAGRGAKQDEIREAAQRLFLARGFAGTTTDAITAEAGVSKETLYRYYASKDAIFADVLGRLTLDNPSDSPLAVLDSSNPATADELRLVLTALAERIGASMFQPDYLALVRVTIAEEPRFPELGALFRERVPERVLAAVERLFCQAQDRGVIERTDVRATARLFIGPLVASLLFDGLLPPGGAPRPPTAEERAALVDLVMNAVMRQPPTEPPGSIRCNESRPAPKRRLSLRLRTRKEKEISPEHLPHDSYE
jgi:TetR/AcrR family transcriptional repressor of mexJK operon